MRLLNTVLTTLQRILRAIAILTTTKSLAKTRTPSSVPSRQQLLSRRGPVLSDLPSWQRTALPPKRSSYHPPHPRQQLLSRQSPVLSDLPSWQRTVPPPQLSSNQPPQPRRQGPVLANLPPLAEDSIATEAASTSPIPGHQQISRFRLAIPATSGPTATDATGSVDTKRRPLANNIADMLTVLYGHTTFQELLSRLATHMPDAEDYHTVHYATSTSTVAPVAVGRAARADPLDQEENTTIFAPTPATCQDCEPDPANIHDSTRCKLAEAPASANQTTMARRLPAEAAQDHTTFSAARHATPGDPTTVRQPSVAHRAPVEAALVRAAPLQDDVIRDRRINHDDSPPKNETVCFCDESTFLYFGRLLQPEVLMIPIPVPSFEDALQSVSDLHPTKEVSRVIFWFSDSHATPLSTAAQLRLAVELSRHYATRYPTVMQFVIATPSVGSRQDVWTCGLFKLLVQMQVTLAHARLVMRPRGSRSVTHADVVALKRYLRDHHHLNLWSCYDADVPRAVDASYPKPQQQRAMQAPTSAEHSAIEAPAVVQTRSQRRTLLKEAKITPKDGTSDAAMHAGPACPLAKRDPDSATACVTALQRNPPTTFHRRLHNPDSAQRLFLQQAAGRPA
ncbi:hypothetical protein AAVH_22097 [Aphelenchoides avenae]|nr:hypothetical protein AAVH_22097 [Aphelenchus avenae]